MRSPEELVSPATLLAALGRGLVAGLAGTAAITAAQELEMRLRGRPPSMIPAHIGSKLLHVEPATETGKTYFNNLVHWSYGALSGLDCAALALLGVRGRAAATTHFAVVWTADMALLLSLGLVPLPWRWMPIELTFHTGYRLCLSLTSHTIYARLQARAHSN